MDWPDFFPEDCPPSDALPAGGNFYRVVLERVSRSLKNQHFHSHREKQRNRQWPPDISECNLCSVSLMKNVEDAKKNAQSIINQIPSMRQSVGRIAQGNLHPHTGKVKHTPDNFNGYQSHYDWWRYNNIEATQFFEFTDLVIERS